MAAKKKAKKKVVKKVVKKVAKKVAKKKVVKKVAKKKVVKKVAKKKRKLNPALMVTLNATPALAAVVGSSRITRQQAIKKFWIYVKKLDLQDSKDRRNINLDEKLKKLFGNKKQINMFEATKYISKNLSK